MLETRQLKSLLPPLSDTDLADVCHDLENAIRGGSPAQVKALVHALVHEVRVEDANTVRPVFKIPTGTDVTNRFAQRAVRWALTDSNRRPARCKRAALTT